MLLSKFQKGFAPLLLLIMIAAVSAAGVGGYFLFNNLNQPAKIKESSNIIHPLFQDLKRSIGDIAEHLDETPSGSDADSAERYSQKGKSLIQTGSDNLDRLKIQVNKLDISGTEEYKKKLTSYITLSEQLILYEKDNVKIGMDYISPLRDYEELSQDVSGVSNYLYSDPARYVKEVGAAIEKEDAIIKRLEALNEDGLFLDYHKSFIQILKTEKDLLSKSRTAVNNRDNTALNDAIKQYSQTSQEDKKKLSRIQDQTKETYKGTISELESLADKIEQQYNELKSQYKF